ncbi:phosphotransferase family protein [Streptomyces mirabilis]|uniref:phosphotransferase family protein n=1 Tax=Streptomyces mirabilis TaxID=68239 RepID=UPI0036CB2CFE
MAWDFSTEPEFEKKLEWIRWFRAERVAPLDLVYPDRAFHPLDEETGPVVRALKQQVRDQGLWAPHLGPELGGRGFGQLKLALINIFDIRRGERRMVLRKPPEKVPPGRNETMLREFRVLNALGGTEVPHPEAIAVCDDTDVIGSCFYLMGHVNGWSPMNTDGWPEPFKSDLSLRPGLAYELVEGIAKLGNVDWRAQGLEGFGRPDGFHDRQVDRWQAHLAKFRFREIPGLDAAAAWLRTHRPRHWEPGIIHGDYQFANVMFKHGAPAELAALVDFEMATVGDPLLDLGWVVMGWPNADEDRDAAGRYADYTGMPDRADIIEHYAKVSGGMSPTSTTT